MSNVVLDIALHNDNNLFCTHLTITLYYCTPNITCCSLLLCTHPVNKHLHRSVSALHPMPPSVDPCTIVRRGFAATKIWTSASVVTPCTWTSFPYKTSTLLLLGTSSHKKIIASFITQLCLSCDGSHYAFMQFLYCAMFDTNPVCIPTRRQGQYQITFIFSPHLPLPNSSTFLI